MYTISNRFNVVVSETHITDMSWHPIMCSWVREENLLSLHFPSNFDFHLTDTAKIVQKMSSLRLM